MSKEFDDLFNDFFKRNRKDKKDENDKSENPLNEKVQKMLDILKGIGGVNIDDEIENELNKLGEPDRIERYINNGLYYEKRVWLTKHGEVIKLLFSEKPFNNSIEKDSIPIAEKSLKEQLEEALLIENFEEAARLRDLITPKKKRIKKEK